MRSIPFMYKVFRPALLMHDLYNQNLFFHMFIVSFPTIIIFKCVRYREVLIKPSFTWKITTFLSSGMLPNYYLFIQNYFLNLKNLLWILIMFLSHYASFLNERLANFFFFFDCQQITLQFCKSPSTPISKTFFCKTSISQSFSTFSSN